MPQRQLGNPRSGQKRHRPATDLPQTGKPGGGAEQPENQRAGPLGTEANGSGEASTGGQPRTEPEEPVSDAEEDASLPAPSAHGAQRAARTDAAPLATPAHHANASTPGEAPPRGPLETLAKSEARETTANRPQRAADIGNIAQRAQPRRRLFGFLHGVLHE